MKINTKYFGDVEIDKKDIYHFDQGLPGFLDEKAFILLPLSEDSPFSVLQSISTIDLAFIVVSPFTFNNRYEIDIPDHIITQLNITSENDVSILVIVTLKEPFEDSTANLLAPLVFNMEKRKAKQVVLKEQSEAIRFPLFQKQIAGQEE